MDRNFRTIVSSVIIGGMILTASITALADTSATSSTTGVSKSFKQQLGRNGHDNMGGQRGEKMMTLGADYIKDLVKEGIITQDTADKLTSYIEERATEKKAEMEKLKAMTEAERKTYMESKKTEENSVSGSKSDPYAGLVEDGILTQAQADAIKAYQKEQMEAKQEEQQAKREAAEKTRIQNLISKGIITQETADAMTEYNETKSEERKAEIEKLKAMTEAERKAYMESKKAEKDTPASTGKDSYAAMVEEGILTQDQADAIKAYDEDQKQADREAQEAKRQEQMETKLDSLVNAGTITKELKADIIEYLNTQEEARNEERKAEMEKLKAMTDTERKAYMESKKVEKTDAKAEVKGPRENQLKELVDNGTLTQAQADAVIKALFQKPASVE